MYNRVLILIIVISVLSGRDIYVSKNAISQYETDDYLLFDAFNDTTESLHQSHPMYYPALDAIDLGADGPILGPTFTQEIRIYRDSGRLDPDWGHLMGYQPGESGSGNNDNEAGRVAGVIKEEEAPFIWKYDGDDIMYGFGDGVTRNYTIVEDVVTEKEVWYHIATTFDGTDYRLYVNGEEVYNYTGCAGKIPYAHPVRYIGGLREGSGRFMGRMDEVRMWDHARTQQQIQETMDQALTGSEDGLVVYYPMDIENEFVLDQSGNNYHGRMIGPVIKSRYFSDECPEPDGTMSCPYPTIASALEDAKAWDHIIIREGRYTEFIMKDGVNIEGTDYNWSLLDPDFGGPPTNTITIEPYPNESVIIDGTISINLTWEPYNHNGHDVYRAVLDSAAIANQIQRPFRSVYGVWIDGRYQIPAVDPNIKNPTDPAYGGPNDHVPGTFWKKEIIPANYLDELPGRLELLDTLEEWAFVPETEMLYIYADDNYMPTSTNVRIRVLHRMMKLRYAANLEFRNIDFFGGSIYLEGFNILVEDCNFAHLHDITLPRFRGNSALCAGVMSLNASFINCIFKHIPFTYSLKIRGIQSLVENCLFTNMDWYTNPNGGAPAVGYVCRYATFENSKIGGIGGGSLMEYCLIEDYLDHCDCGGINRGAHGAPKSMTRYNWMINGPGANGMRFDGGKTGAGNRRGDVHHIVTLGNHRGMRLKGDYHEVYHVTAYDNWMWDIDLFTGKYGEPGDLNQGYNLHYTPGNRNSTLKNSIAESSLGCPTSDCWENPEAGDSWTNPLDPIPLLSSGIWSGRSLGSPLPHYELTDPWFKNLYAEDSSPIYADGYPHPTDRSQDYDFRPKKGSSLIDAGVVIPGINDGQDLQFNWPPSYPGQNRKYVGEAPDIGAYEYGDSVYWIPGYRYPYPSFPIPRNNATNVIPDYSVVWNYPYKKDYSGTEATVTINGPGVNRTETFQYPNNVFFQSFQPSGIYTWTVSVDGISGGTWSFQVDSNIYPMNDRSIDITESEIILSTKQKYLEVYKNNVTFLRFDIPPSVDGSWNTDLNLFVRDIQNLDGGIVIHRYDNIGWSEKNDSYNIGIIDHTLGSPIDTLHNLESNSVATISLNNIINAPGEYAFALTVLDSNDHVSFHSNEATYTSGYTPYPIYWPSISLTPSTSSLNIVLSDPDDNSTVILNDSSDDSVQFSWRFSHDLEPEVDFYTLRLGLIHSEDAQNLDTLFTELDVSNNNKNIHKRDLLDMLIQENLPQGVFIWDVSGVMPNGEMIAISTHRFNAIIDDPNYESIFPNEFRLYNNYPNPFNPYTTISYDIKEWSIVGLSIFDLLGRRIMEFEKRLKAPGRYTTQWYSKNDLGLKVPSGIYFYQLAVQDPITGRNLFTKTEKMTLLK